MSPRKREITRVWRVFYTTPRAEKKVETRLRDREIEVYLPTRTVLKQWSDRKQKVVEVLFPNYVFAKVDEPERLRALQTDGVVRCVMAGPQPARISEEEIEQIRLAQLDPERLEVMQYPLPPKAAKVEVIDGPLKGLKGEVVEIRGQLHVAVSIPAIRQALTVSVPVQWLRVEPPAP